MNNFLRHAWSPVRWAAHLHSDRCIQMQQMHGYPRYNACIVNIVNSTFNSCQIEFILFILPNPSVLRQEGWYNKHVRTYLRNRNPTGWVFCIVYRDTSCGTCARCLFRARHRGVLIGAAHFIPPYLIHHYHKQYSHPECVLRPRPRKRYKIPDFLQSTSPLKLSASSARRPVHVASTQWGFQGGRRVLGFMPQSRIPTIRTQYSSGSF